MAVKFCSVAALPVEISSRCRVGETDACSRPAVKASSLSVVKGSQAVENQNAQKTRLGEVIQEHLDADYWRALLNNVSF